jgi:Flp pilus assembly protein TadG
MQARRWVWANLLQLGRSREGNVAIIVAAAIVPLLGALGLATDTARGYLVKARLSQALDTAALAGAKNYYASTRNDDVKKFFGANFPSPTSPVFDTPYQASFMDAQVTLATPVQTGDQTSPGLKLSGTAVISTTFMRLLGFQNVTVTAVAEAKRAVSALDLVLSFDMSASMGNPGTKETGARDAAITLLDTLYGANNNTSPQLTVDGVTYNLLNVGFVPWNAEVNVRVQQTATSLAPIPSAPVTKNVGSFTNPVIGQSQSVIYYSDSNKSVPLLMDPRDTSAGGQLPGGWSGCVYARYLGGEISTGNNASPNNDDNSNDADLVRGPVTVHDPNDGNDYQWLGYEPEGKADGEPQSGTWTGSQGPSNTRWVTSSTWNAKTCNNEYFLDDGTTNLDNADGSIRSSPSPYTSTNTSRPAAIPNPKGAPSSSYSGTFHFIDPSKPYAVPAIGGNNGNPSSTSPSSYDCTPCLSRGIIPLTSNKGLVKTILQGIQGTDPTGNTNTLQGLYWAWEVLMPGEPFNQAVPAVPFPRTRAIVVLTDGELFIGAPGDAYKGHFGYHEIAGTNSDAHLGTITVGGATVQNNLDHRLYALANNIKAEGTKIYVVAFNIQNQFDITRLQPIASPPDQNGQYFFEAPTTADLQAVFAQIAASLSNLRLSM